MNNHYSDFEKLRPTGEASHIPDVKLTNGGDGDPRRQHVATTTGGYPNEPATTDGECRSCSASIPAGQTKCRFGLTNHLGDDAIGTDESVETALLGIVHLVVESTTFYGAVAKGGARRISSPPTRRSGPSTTTRSSTILTRHRRAS